MRKDELILYTDFRDGEILNDMAWLMEVYEAASERENARRVLYRNIHRLVELAGTYGFHGNLWHCYLTNLLVNNENSYSCGCEIRGEIQGTINDVALHDIAIFKELYDYDFAPMCEKLCVPEFSIDRKSVV